MRKFDLTRWLLVVIILMGFWLRVHRLTVPDLTLDEAWSYVHMIKLVDGEPLALAVEPNIALHLLLLAPWHGLDSIPFLMRWLSVILGTLTIPIAARLAYRLYGSMRAVWITTLVVALGGLLIEDSQLARPYNLAVFMGSLSMLFWAEKNWGWNLLASIGLVFSHVAALPIVITQDVFTAWRWWQGKPVSLFMWLSNRFMVYLAVLGMYRAFRARSEIGKVISSGQTMPSVQAFINYLSYLIVYERDWRTLIAVNTVGMGLLALIAGVILYNFWRIEDKRYRSALMLAATWIGLSFAMLIGGVLVGSGPIKFPHLSHLTLAVGLLIGSVAWHRQLTLAIVALLLISALISLPNFYKQPFSQYTEAQHEIDAVRGAEPLYSLEYTTLWAFQVNNPPGVNLHVLYDTDPLPTAPYYYLESYLQGTQAPGCVLVKALPGIRLFRCE